MPKKSSILSPTKAETANTINTVIATVLAVLARSCLLQPSVALMKIGMLPIGFTMANNAMVTLSRVAQSVM